MRQTAFRASWLLLLAGMACHSGSTSARLMARRLPDSVLARERDSLARMVDSMKRMFIEERLHGGIVQPEGPALIAFYPAPFRAPVLGDGDLSRAIADF